MTYIWSHQWHIWSHHWHIFDHTNDIYLITTITPMTYIWSHQWHIWSHQWHIWSHQWHIFEHTNDIFDHTNDIFDHTNDIYLITPMTYIWSQQSHQWHIFDHTNDIYSAAERTHAITQPFTLVSYYQLCFRSKYPLQNPNIFGQNPLIIHTLSCAYCTLNPHFSLVLYFAISLCLHKE
jgi:hypothetical protein